MQATIIIPTLNLGGAGKVAINQAKYLEKTLKIKTRIITFNVKYNEINTIYHDIGFNIPVFRTSLSLLNIILSDKILEKIDINKTDIIIAHGLGTILAYKIYKKYKIPYIAYIHHPNGFLYNKEIHRNERKSTLGLLAVYPIYKVIHKKLSSLDRESIVNSSHILVNSKHTLRNTLLVYGDNISRTKIDVCYPAIDDKYHAITNITEKKQNHIIYTSRHVKQKGFHLLPEILKEIRSDTKIIITGRKTKLTDTILKKMADYGLKNRVIMRLNVSENELLELYLVSKVLLFPAINEDFGLSPVEGMATGAVPVVWGDEGGINETVIHGKTGFQAKPYDLGEFASIVDNLLVDQSLYIEVAYNAKCFSKKFTWKNHVEKIWYIAKKVV